MKVSRAIKVLENELEAGGFNPGALYPKAVKLGIEALKQVMESRFDPSSWTPQTLPGETPEEEVKS